MSKSELIQTKQQLLRTQQGHALLDKKLVILSAELAGFEHQLRQLDSQLGQKLAAAKAQIKEANLQGAYLLTHGQSTATDTSLEQLTGSVLGVDVPLLRWQEPMPLGELAEQMPEAMGTARVYFLEIKELVIKKAMLVRAISALKQARERTNVRVNALNYQVIPRKKNRISQLEMGQSEEEREAFIRVSLGKSRLQT